LYASLFKLDANAPYSWGEISTAGDLLNHFLRKDYGTFRLAPSGEISYFRTFAWLGETILKDFWMFLIAAVFATPLMKREGPNRWHVRPRDAGAKFVLLSLALYVFVFFAMANVDPRGSGSEIIERFFILPIVLVAFLLTRVLDGAIDEIGDQRARKALYFVLACALINPPRHVIANDFSRNTIVEDYARNLLAMADSDRPTIFLAGTDTELFATRYVQAVWGLGPRVLPVTDAMLLHSWQSRKAAKSIPEFSFASERIASAKTLHLVDDLYAPNLDRIDFLSTTPVPDIYGFTFMALGRKVKREVGVAFDESSLARLKFTNPPEIPSRRFDPGEFSTELMLQAKYAHYHLARGLDRARTNDLEAAAKAFQEALAKVPYCKPAVGNLCQLKSKTAAAANFDCDGQRIQQAEFYDYF
jgi:hypothetical protein